MLKLREAEIELSIGQEIGIVCRKLEICEADLFTAGVRNMVD